MQLRHSVTLEMQYKIPTMKKLQAYFDLNIHEVELSSSLPISPPLQKKNPHFYHFHKNKTEQNKTKHVQENKPIILVILIEKPKIGCQDISLAFSLPQN